jgi:hypothetical protein
VVKRLGARTLILPPLLSVLSSKEPKDPEQLYSTLKNILQQVKVGVFVFYLMLLF